MDAKSEEIAFTKMTGTGNDFIVFDNRSRLCSGEESTFFHEICQRRTSVGADGILLVEKGDSAPVRMRYFNRDGSEATMCGNGARCAAYFAWKKGMVPDRSFSLEALDGVHRVIVEGERITLEMARPQGFQSKPGILRESELFEGGFIDTGVPHYVIFVQDVEKVDVDQLGSFYRNHDAFVQGTNVNFVQFLGMNRIRVRTYERGVEAETLSCGTGCVASSLITSRHHGYTSPITVLTLGGRLTVQFDEVWEKIFLIGPVEIVYEGIMIRRSLRDAEGHR